MNDTFENIKKTVNENPVLRNTVEITTQVTKAVAMGLLIRAGTFIVVEGTKALIAEVTKNIGKTDSAE